MLEINHIFEPSRLYLVWHHRGDDTPRHRRIIGELYKHDDSVKFRYLTDSVDYQEAVKEGFIGFPAFTKSSETFDDALDAFMTRLPPRKRADFGKYLSQYGLPADFNGSDMALLGYTGARLASDSFELCPDYSDVTKPADLITELSGVQYHVTPDNVPLPGDPVSFTPESDNPHDVNAVAVFCGLNKIGYVNKTTALGFRHILENMNISASILKSGTREAKIKILIMVMCR